jgi:hypothetical protein
MRASVITKCLLGVTTPSTTQQINVGYTWSVMDAVRFIVLCFVDACILVLAFVQGWRAKPKSEAALGDF